MYGPLIDSNLYDSCTLYSVQYLPLKNLFGCTICHSANIPPSNGKWFLSLRGPRRMICRHMVHNLSFEILHDKNMISVMVLDKAHHSQSVQAVDFLAWVSAESG